MTNRDDNKATDLDVTGLNQKLMKALTRLRDLHEAMTIWQAASFIQVVIDEGIRQDELYRRLDMADSSASRTIALLSDVGARGTAGLDLIKVQIDDDRRYRRIYLTPKGRRLATSLAEILGGK